MEGAYCPLAALLLALGSVAAYNPVIVEVPPDPDAEVIETLKNVSHQVYVITFVGRDKIEFCNGAIIEKRHILTAASCVLKGKIEGIPKVQVMVQHGVGLKPSIATFDVVTATFYEKQRKEHVEEDIVILETDRPMLPDEEVKLIVELQTKKRYRSKNCKLTGWADEEKIEKELISQHKIPPPTLLWHLHSVAWKRCFREDSVHKPPTDLLCIGKRGYRRNTCQEEPGAPVVCDGQLTGVVSGSLGCTSHAFALLYTDVGYYRPWIDATLRKHSRHEALSHGAWQSMRALRPPPHDDDAQKPPRRRRRRH